MPYPKISIITPTLNQARFIEQTIESVLSQNYPNLEYFVIDGGSTDSTLKILEYYSGRLKWISEKDKGQADAINKGIHKSSGEIIAFINSDDYYLPGVFFEIADLFCSHPEYSWVTGSYKIINSNNEPIQPLVVQYKNLLRKASSPSLLRLANYIVQPSTFWRSSVHDKIGDFNIHLRYAFDYDFWLRLMDFSKPYCTNKPWTAFRIHAESKGGRDFFDQFNEELDILKKYDTKKEDYDLHRILNKLIIGMYRIIK